MKKKYLVSIILFLIIILNGWSQQKFRFNHPKNLKYRILSTVSEDVHLNGKFSHHSNITNKVSVKVIQEYKDKTGKTGEIEAKFYLTEQFDFNKQTFSVLNKSYLSTFTRNSLGLYANDDKAFMPVVRNVPLFPEHPVCVGESWTSSSYEVHDFSGQPFQISNPYHFPIQVNYQYLGKTIVNNRELDKIAINYIVFHNDKNKYNQNARAPHRISGRSNQILIWDNKKGIPYSYAEKFQLIISLTDGNEIEYIGTAKALLLESENLDQKKLKKEFEKELGKSNKDYSLIQKKEGLSLVLNNIQFYPNSSQILPGEEKKLETIARLLKKIPDRDIRVIGHTALAGTLKDRKDLSISRATFVANFLINNNIRKSDRVMIEGKGASDPIASNFTAAGMRANRRVEILILEN